MSTQSYEHDAIFMKHNNSWHVAADTKHITQPQENGIVIITKRNGSKQRMRLGKYICEKNGYKLFTIGKSLKAKVVPFQEYWDYTHEMYSANNKPQKTKVF